ncbi:hypothetical protein BC832DRAFT_557980 [Gaertneriomyces semiglobifer]|nr:hypothetical protein BC832DRAFT_557980 [Gaertneriomyces semiglobifer]
MNYRRLPIYGKAGISSCGPYVRPTACVGFWIAMSSAAMWSNRFILDEVGFSHPMFLATWQLLFVSIATRLLAYFTPYLNDLNDSKMTRTAYMKTIVPVGLCFSGTLVFLNLAYLYLPVPYMQMLKATTPVAVLIIGWTLGTQDLNTTLMIKVSLVAWGAIVTSFGEAPFSFLGFMFQAAGILMEATRLVLVSKLLRAYDMSPLCSLYHFAPVCTILNLVAFVFFESHSLSVESIRHVGFPTLVLNGFVAFGLHVAVVFLIDSTSALALCLAGIWHEIMLVSVSSIAWKAGMTITQIQGYAISLFGLLWFQRPIKMLGKLDVDAKGTSRARWALMIFCITLPFLTARSRYAPSSFLRDAWSTTGVVAIFSHPPIIREACNRTIFEAKTPSTVVNVRALVTGGAGFIGSHLVGKLLELGYKVRVVDNLSTGYYHNIATFLENPNFEFIYGDILDRQAVKKAMNDVQFVYHLATVTKVPLSANIPDMTDVWVKPNALGTRRVLEAAQHHKIQKVVYAASSTYYGNGKVPMNEYEPANILTPYAASKHKGELLMYRYDRVFSLPTISLRIFTVYGPRQPASGPYATGVGAFLKRVSENQTLLIEGDGSQTRDYIHVRDIVESLILAQQSEQHGITVNAGTGRTHSLQSVADLISQNQTHVPGRKDNVVATQADTCRAEAKLGFRASADFITEMKILINQTQHPASVDPQLVTKYKSAPWLLPPNRSIFRYQQRGLENDLERLAQIVAPEKRITVMLFHDKYRAITENAIYSMIEYGKVTAYLVGALDEASLATCIEMNLPCFNASAFAPVKLQGEAVTEYAWAAISWVKPRMVNQLLRLGYTVHMTDADISYIRDVWTSFEQFMQEADADMTIAYEELTTVNTGNYVVVPNERTFRFFDVYLAKGEANFEQPDQWAWGDVARAGHAEYCQTKGECAKAKEKGVIAIRDFAAAFGRNPPCPRSIDLCSPEINYIHPVCMLGMVKKVTTHKQLGSWFMQDCPPTSKNTCIGIPKRDGREQLPCLGTVANLTAGL